MWVSAADIYCRHPFSVFCILNFVFLFYVIYFQQWIQCQPYRWDECDGKGNRWNPIPVFSLKGYLSLSKQKRWRGGKEKRKEKGEERGKMGKHAERIRRTRLDHLSFGRNISSNSWRCHPCVAMSSYSHLLFDRPFFLSLHSLSLYPRISSSVLFFFSLSIAVWYKDWPWW